MIFITAAFITTWLHYNNGLVLSIMEVISRSTTCQQMYKQTFAYIEMPRTPQ